MIELPKTTLALTPTPLVEAPVLTGRLGGPRILLKRDDLTGRGVGGNKVRKLEYLFRQARDSGCTHVVTGGGVQSNHACLTALCAGTVGLQSVLVLGATEPPEPVGNVLLETILGTDIRCLPVYDPDALEREMARVCRELEQQGHKALLIPLGGSTPVGILGYRDCFTEMSTQWSERKILPTAIYSAAGTGGTLAGLILGARQAGYSGRLVGVDVGALPEGPASRVKALLAAHGIEDPGESTTIDRSHIGPGYARPDRACLEAMRLFLDTEGVVLDPAYTGKAAAAMIRDIRHETFSVTDTVIFIHTGGLGGLFSGTLRNYLKERDLS